MPLIETKGAASAQGFGEFLQTSGSATYIEDVFSTNLYTGTGSTQTITTGINLSTYGGMVWDKLRNSASNHYLANTTSGVTKYMSSNDTTGQTTSSNIFSSVSTTGVTIGSSINGATDTGVVWSFRKQAKFFDVVTYTGNGVSGRTVSHNLGSVPGFIIVKKTNATANWPIYHRSIGPSALLFLNLTSDIVYNSTRWADTTPTSTVFTLGNAADVNQNGDTYVAYLFAHNAGGFGTAGTDNVISCGSFTTDGSGNYSEVNLGYEPQWVLMKSSTAVTDWSIVDNMRGWTGTNTQLKANSSAAENNNYTGGTLTATGFKQSTALLDPGTYIYIAIRRGPMKTPTSGTSVFSPITYVGAGGVTQNISAGFPVDADIIKIRNAGGRDPLTHTRLTGPVFLKTDSPISQLNFSDNIVSFSAGQNVIGLPAGTGTNEVNGDPTSTYIALAMRRAPSFMDLVCFTSSASGNKTFNHNLGVSPELMLLKNRQTSDPWIVYSQPTGNNAYLMLNTTDASQPNASSFSVSSTSVTVSITLMYNSQNYIAYLFASCSGVSKVGSYSGTGATQTISCGFVARFVMIKRTDTTGSWWYWDTGRGMVAGTDPRLAFNSANAETNANWVYTDASGFQIVTTDADVNASGGTYIYLAIA